VKRSGSFESSHSNSISQLVRSSITLERIDTNHNHILTANTSKNKFDEHNNDSSLFFLLFLNTYKGIIVLFLYLYTFEITPIRDLG
jgi:hypothetical protein